MEFALIVAGIITLTVAVQIIVSRRRARAFAPADDALAECWAVPNQPFELAIPASGPVDLILTMHADGAARKHGLRWGVTATLTAERPPAETAGYRGGAEPFRLAVDAYAGSQTPRTKSGYPRVHAETLDGSVTNMSASVKVRLARIPEGGQFVLRGTVEVAATTSVTSVWIAAHLVK